MPTPEEQLKEDRKLIERLENFGGEMSEGDTNYMESFVRRVKDEGRPLSEKQRAVAENLERRYLD
jgi:hypothetical protein